jgi:spore coat protein CotF
MSGKERFAESLQNFGTAGIQAGEKMLRFAIDTEATQYKLDIAKQIEEFKQSLSTDSNFGSPLATEPEGYMKKWQDFQDSLSKSTEKIKNPAVRNAVDDYIKAVLPEQQSIIATAQFKGWGKQQVANVQEQILEARKNVSPEQFLSFADSQLKGLLEVNLIAPEDYHSSMDAFAQLSISDNLFNEAAKIFDEKGEASALDYLANAATLVTLNGRTYTISDNTRQVASTRLSLHAKAADEEAWNSIQDMFYQYLGQAAGRQLKEGEQPITYQDILSAIDKSKVRDKEPLYRTANQFYQLSVTSRNDEGVKKVVDAMMAYEKGHRGETLTPEEQQQAAAWKDGSIVKNNLSGQPAATWEEYRIGKFDQEQAEEKKALADADKTAASGIIDTVSKIGYGIPLNEGEKEYTRESAKIAIDSLVNLTPEEKDAKKKEVDFYFNTKDTRLQNEGYDQTENLLYASIVEMNKKLLGLPYDETKIIPEEKLPDYADSLREGRLGYFQGQYLLVRQKEQEKQQESNRKLALGGFIKAFASYDENPSNPLPTQEEIDAAYANGNGAITQDDYDYLTKQRTSRVNLAKKDAELKENNTKHNTALWGVINGRDALRKQLSGETLKEGEVPLSYDWIKANVPEDLQDWAIKILDQETDRARQLNDMVAKAKEQGQNEEKLIEFNKKYYLKQLTPEEVNAAADAKEITAQQQSVYLSWLTNDAEAEKKLAEAQEAQKKATENILLIYDANKNLIKKNKGEELPEGAPILSEQWAREQGFDKSELSIALDLLDAENARVEKEAAEKDKANKDKLLLDALLVSDESARNEYKIPVTGQELTPEYVRQVLGDDAASSPYMNLARAFENNKAQAETKAKEKAWQEREAEAERNTIKWAMGQEYTGEILNDDLINAMPESMDPENKTLLQTRLANYINQHNEKEISLQREALHNSVLVTIKQANGEKVEGVPLSRSAIWASDLPFNEKYTLDNIYQSYYEKVDKANSSLEAAQFEATLDAFKAGAIALADKKAGKKYAGYMGYWSNGKYVALDLTKDNAEKEYMTLLEGFRPYAAQYNKQEDLQNCISIINGSKPISTSPWNTVDDALNDLTKPHGTKPAIIPPGMKQYYIDWIESQKTLNPNPSASQVEDIIKHLKDDPWVIKASADFSLATGGILNQKNDVDKIMDLIVSGNAAWYMGLSPDGQPIPVHPAYKDAAEWWKNSIIKAANKWGAPGFEDIQIGTNALGAYTADGQYWICMENNNSTKKIFDKMGIGKAKRVNFSLGQIDGQAYLTRQIYYDGTDMNPIGQVLKNDGKWVDVDYTSRQYVYKFHK